MLTRPGMILVGTALLATLSGSASGQADLRVVASNSRVEVSVDVGSIKRVEGSHTEVRVLTIYRETQRQEGVPPFDATMAVLWIRCATVEGSIATLIFLASSGQPDKRIDYPVQWRPVDSKTDVGIVWKYICTRGWEGETVR